MSEEQQVPNHREVMEDLVKDPVFIKQHWEGRSQDQLLQLIVQHTNDNVGNRHPITLTVGGNLVSGHLIDADAYMDAMADQFASQFDEGDGSADSIRRSIVGLKYIPNEDLEKNVPPQFIHLEDAEVFTSSGRPIVSGGLLWRGKLSSVDGFSIGRIEATSPSPN